MSNQKPHKQIDNLFNGYVFASSSEYNSSDSDDGDNNLNQGDASHFGEDSDHQVHVSKSFPFEDKNQNDSKHVVAVKIPHSEFTPPQCIRKKKVLWDNLNSILVENDCLSVIVGDFNEVRNPDERMGSLFCPRGANLFNNFISSSGLNDLPLGGMRFTRMNRSGTKLSKLDRILVSYHFMNQWPNAHVKTLIHGFSDHAPLLLCVASPDYGPVPFRFYNSWLLKEDFRSLLHNSWSCVLERPSSKAIIFKSKLQRLKASIKQWLHMSQASENSSVNALRDTLLAIDLKAESNNLSIQDIESKFKEDDISRPTFSSNLFKQLLIEDSLFLDLPFSSQEIKNAVWSSGGEKPLGPDDFTFKFIKKHWDVFSHDIISFVKEFESSAFIPRGCNSSFITFVPKIDDPLNLNDFRPISLIGCQYKIVAKILANRLSSVISSVVSDVQMTFIKGRQIIDGPLMVDEIISWANVAKKKVFFLKVDFEKAFDTLNWSFLEYVMDQIGFSNKWRLWIRACLGSAYTSVLINGSPTREFKLEKGLRQGDPLSPLLFILAVEALNVALLEARNNHSFRGIEVEKDKVCVSHLQFADDALIMGEWSKINVLNLSRLLTCFHLASGLKVNFNKSKLFGIGVCEVERNSLASLIGCEPSNFPCNYLGLPIGANMSRCDNWFLLLERFHKCLSSWKAKTLSFGGRLTLSKSVLGSLGIEDWKWRINKFLEGSLGGKFFSLQCLPKVTEHPDSDSGKGEFMSLMMFSKLLFSEAECNSRLIFISLMTSAWYSLRSKLKDAIRE
ncbi:putative RNA-directed DNA polymerase, eukaryota, reverse transcriptase zinc-binding domain protein [Tanacetum coccineum]|uniref:RNA-directed DNA polymerase, eukaryota, reverse transcriptase zinc-binding domain protein n=1 Tax=Tanacetum coccineum TaxID=301880 RepID=A0ABQ5I4Q8_9ASTR